MIGITCGPAQLCASFEGFLLHSVCIILICIKFATTTMYEIQIAPIYKQKANMKLFWMYLSCR